MWRKAPGEWLLVAPTNQCELDDMIRRIQNNARAANRSPVGETLPELVLEVIGTWRIGAQDDEFVARFAAALQPTELECAARPEVRGSGVMNHA